MLYLTIGLTMGIAIGFFSGFALRAWAMEKKKQKDRKTVCEKLGVSEEEYERFIKKLSLVTGEELVSVLKGIGLKKKSEDMKAAQEEKSFIEIYFEELLNWFSNPFR